MRPWPPSTASRWPRSRSPPWRTSTWPSTPPGRPRPGGRPRLSADRKRAVLRFHDLLLSHRDEGLDLIQWETGKTRMDALKELLGVCTVARHYARDARRLLGPRAQARPLPAAHEGVGGAPSGRCGGRHRTLELPAVPGGGRCDPRAHGRQRRGAQARPPDVADRPVGRGPHAPRRHPPPGPAGRARVRSRARPGDHRARRLHDVHRLQRRGCADRRPMRRAAHRLLDGARRQEPA